MGTVAHVPRRRPRQFDSTGRYIDGDHIHTVDAAQFEKNLHDRPFDGPAGIEIKVRVRGKDGIHNFDINQIQAVGIGAKVFRCPNPDCDDTHATRANVKKHWNYLSCRKDAKYANVSYRHHRTLASFNPKGYPDENVGPPFADEERHKAQSVQKASDQDNDVAARPDGSNTSPITVSSDENSDSSMNQNVNPSLPQGTSSFDTDVLPFDAVPDLRYLNELVTTESEGLRLMDSLAMRNSMPRPADSNRMSEANSSRQEQFHLGHTWPQRQLGEPATLGAEDFSTPQLDSYDENNQFYDDPSASPPSVPDIEARESDSAGIQADASGPTSVVHLAEDIESQHDAGEAPVHSQVPTHSQSSDVVGNTAAISEGNGDASDPRFAARVRALSDKLRRFRNRFQSYRTMSQGPESSPGPAERYLEEFQHDVDSLLQS